MAFGELKKVLVGFGLGALFIILSGLLTGGVLFADALLKFTFTSNFIVFGIPYGFIAAVIYSLILKFRKTDYYFKKGILFGIGFCLSFSILYIIMYLAFSNFQGL